MVDWQTASYIAGVLGNAITSVDRIYRGDAEFFKKKERAASTPPPDFNIHDKPDEQALVATSLNSGQTYQAVTYEDLRAKLNPGDRAYLETLSRVLENYEKQ